MLTGRERIACILARKPVDRIGAFEHFWNDTQKSWAAEGHIRADENLSDHFGYDLELSWPFTMTADLDFVPQIIEETAETKLVRDGNGALLRQHKLHDSTPEHVDFLVKERAAWEEHIKPLLRPDPRRIDFAAYRATRDHAAAHGLFFCWCGVNVFEIIKDVTGHEHMLVGMALDPDWIRDMVDTYTNLVLQLQEILFEREGWPDGIWYYEDMGFKQRPFMSPTMYKEIIQPGHTRTFGFARGHKAAGHRAFMRVRGAAGSRSHRERDELPAGHRDQGGHGPVEAPPGVRGSALLHGRDRRAHPLHQ